MNQRIAANSLMNNYLHKNTNIDIEIENRVFNELYAYSNTIKKNEENGLVWLSDITHFLSYEKIVSSFSNLSLFEWEEFELYFYGKDVKEKAGTYVHSLIKNFEETIVKKIALDIVLCVWIQEEDWFNIKAKFHIFRNGETCINNIEKCIDPIIIVHYLK